MCVGGGGGAQNEHVCDVCDVSIIIDIQNNEMYSLVN